METNNEIMQVEIVGQTPVMQQVRNLVMQVAKSDASVLILGESGTGKEIIARNIHLHSSRQKKPFVPLNCGAIPGELLESELFGHVKGAFTGAVTNRRGRFEKAKGGTLFLDEIGDMPMPMQVKLLRVLQEHQFEPVGSNETMEADVRIIAATHCDLESAIAEERFREDLFYRLNVFPIEVPPLREHYEDIPLLIQEINTRLEKQNIKPIHLLPRAIQCLKHYSWPGNVRELENLIERLIILFPKGIVDFTDLPKKFRKDFDVNTDLVADEMVYSEEYTLGTAEQNKDNVISSVGDITSQTVLPKNGIDLKKHLESIEISLIRQALEHNNNVVVKAAKHLNLRRTTLIEKMRKYGISRIEKVGI